MSNQRQHERTTLPSGASYPTYLEPLTEQEQSLLDTYAVIKSYEKEAARLKAEEAKRRLDEADERYRAKVREMEGVNEINEEEADKTKPESQRRESHEDYESEQDEESKQKHLQREKEISQLRREVAKAREAKDNEEAKHKLKREKEEALRKDMLGEQSTTEQTENKKRSRESHEDEADETEDKTFTGPSIKKKRVKSSERDDFQPQPSLIANIGGDSTPPHDFSKKMGMSKTSLDGTTLFPKDGSIQPWTPPSKPHDFIDGCLELELCDFDPMALGEGNNTVAIKFHAPDESSRFSVNIAQQDHGGYENILFHFNPRHFQRGGQLVRGFVCAFIFCMTFLCSSMDSWLTLKIYISDLSTGNQ